MNLTEEEVDKLTQVYIENLRHQIKELQEEKVSVGEKIGILLAFFIVFFVGMLIGSYLF